MIADHLVSDRLRQGCADLLAHKISSITKVPMAESRPTAKQYEVALHERMLLIWTPKRKEKTRKECYADTIRMAITALSDSPGEFPDFPLASRLMSKKIGVRRAATLDILQDHVNRDKRSIIRRMLLRILLQDKRMAGSRAAALKLAYKLEWGCYNYAIEKSKRSEIPFSRRWDSQQFVDIYSSRCGTLASHINPNGSVCRKYGKDFLEKLITGAINPRDVFFMQASDMCPAATRKVRSEIATRNSQKIEDKPSDMFQCPHCRARMCTYREEQRRSLDEPANIYCHCLKCNKPFRGA